MLEPTSNPERLYFSSDFTAEPGVGDGVRPLEPQPKGGETPIQRPDIGLIRLLTLDDFVDALGCPLLIFRPLLLSGEPTGAERLKAVIGN
jgi:hypothetical protein